MLRSRKGTPKFAVNTETPKLFYLPTITPKSIRSSLPSSTEISNFDALKKYPKKTISSKSSNSVPRHLSHDFPSQTRTIKEIKGYILRKRKTPFQLPSIRDDELKQSLPANKDSINVQTAAIQVKKSVSRIRKLIAKANTPV